MQEHPSYFSILPAVVRYDNNLPVYARLLYSELTALTSKEGYCFASNNYFAELYEVTPQAVSKWVKALAERGYIKIEYVYSGKEIKERHIYLLETKTIQKNPENEEQKNSKVSIKNCEVSTNDCGGINVRLRGYQRTIKDNNTSIITKDNNTSSSCPQSDFPPEPDLLSKPDSCFSATAEKERKTKQKRKSFPRDMYDKVIERYNHNLSKINPSARGMTYTDSRSLWHSVFTRFPNVNDVLTILDNGLKDTWVVNTAGYSFKSMFGGSQALKLLNGQISSQNQFKMSAVDKFYKNKEGQEIDYESGLDEF